MTLVGTLPLRKPLILAVRAISRSRSPTTPSRRSAGRLTVRRRSRLAVFSSETCISTPATAPFLGRENEKTRGAPAHPRASVAGWCERRDSNSHGLPHWNLNPARLPVPPLSQLRAVTIQSGRLVGREGFEPSTY